MTEPDRTSEIDDRHTIEHWADKPTLKHSGALEGLQVSVHAAVVRDTRSRIVVERIAVVDALQANDADTTPHVVHVPLPLLDSVIEQLQQVRDELKKLDDD